MKIKFTREQKIGLFAILTLFALYVVINYLRGEDLFGKSNVYYARYESVEGVNTTGPVFIKGLKVGTIESIEYKEKSNNFLVSLKIDSKYKISDSSVAQIYSSDILGGKAIRINMSKGTKILGDADTLLTSIEPGMLDMLSNELIPLKNQATALLENMNKTFDNVNDVLDSNAKDNLAKSLENLNKTLKSVRAIAQNLENNGPEISSILDNLDKISTTLNGSAGHLDSSLKNFSEITDSLKKADIAGTIESLKMLIVDVRNPEGSLGKLIKTDSLHNSIDSLLRNLDVLVTSINRDPKKYIKISVF
ncbi:MAG: MlaD family protein [Bacteroidales bacterium]|jgi:phospholipid/cholesterol/gamma-HCH transport system substrate-binding protein